MIVQFGGQTPLKLAVPLERAGVPILGTSPDAIDRAEDRERFNAMVEKLGLRQPRGMLARSLDEAVAVADASRLPGADSALLRAGRPRDGDRRGRSAVCGATSSRRCALPSEHPLLIDRYLDGAIEVDVDAISDGETVVIGGIMEHVEHAGIHSGDSACVLPPRTLGADDSGAN